MKQLTYTTTIHATPEQVWSTMLDPVTYQEWTGVSWPDSYFEGNWKQGENIRFISPDGSGTLVAITALRPYEHIAARHIAILEKGGVEDKTSEAAKGWIGTGENYTFTAHDGFTELTIELEINPEWEKMFSEGWPRALEALKKITEEK
ncbi:MAG: SRPBCC domain-containing protein [Williamsia sp.]|nr:SRPBCC domain-containing protein [Williamsia sp.]